MHDRSLRLIRQAVVTGFSAVVFLALGGSAEANLVQNGQFQVDTNLAPNFATGATTFCQTGMTSCNSVVYGGWYSTCVSGTSGGTCSATDPVIDVLTPNPGGQAAFNDFIGLADPTPFGAPPFGGNIVADDGDNVNFGVPFSQVINGLTAGDTYALTFYQSADQQNGISTPFTENWQVSLGAQTQYSATMNYPATPWSLQTLNFTASSSSEVLSFLADGPTGVPPVALLGDVSLTQVTPEPSYYVAIGLGMIALFAMVWRRKKRA